MRHIFILPIFLSLVALSARSHAVELPRLSELEPGPRGDKGLFAEPWEIWMSQPISSPLLFEASAQAASGTDVTIAIGGQTFQVGGVGCGSLSSTNKFYPNLRAHIPYTLTVSGPNWSELNLTFKGYIPRGILQIRGPNSIPRAYQVFINGKELLDTDTLQLAYACGNNSTNMTLEIRPDRGFRPTILGSYEEQWSSDEDQDTEAAPGDGHWLELGPGRSADPQTTAFRWAVNLGKLLNGMTAGKIRLSEEAISSNVFSGANLSYTARTTNALEIDVRLTTNGILRQIRAPQALADITSATSPSEECVIRFYTLQNVGSSTNGSGLYPILTNSPFVVWRLKNPNSPGTYTRLQVVEERPASRTYAADLQFEGTNVWKLSYGSGSEERIERRTVLLAAPSRRETVTVASPSATIYKAVEDYRHFLWGWELTNVVTNPDGQGLTNRFRYHTDEAEQSSFGKLYERWSPGDKWEVSCYPFEDNDGRKAAGWPFSSNTNYADIPVETTAPQVVRIRPWKDGPANPSDGNQTNVVFNEYKRKYDAVSSKYTSEFSTDVRYATNSLTADRIVVAQDDVRDGDYENTTLFVRQDYRFKTMGAEARSQGHYILRFKAIGNWRNDLVRLHKGPDEIEDLFEYTPGTLSSSNSWTVNTNALDFRIVKTTGQSGFGYSIYDMAEYWDSVPEPEAGGAIAIYCVKGKSTQETSFLRAGDTVYVELYGMSGIQSSAPTWDLIEKRQLYYDALGHLTNITWFDGTNGSVSRVLYEASWKDGAGNDSELKQFEILESGDRINYSYDSLKRLTNATLVGASANGVYPQIPDISTNFTYNAAGWPLQTAVSGGGITLSETRQYDAAGRLTNVVNFDQTAVAVSYSADTRVVTETFPGSLTKVTTRFLDGRLKSITGTSLVQEHFDYETAAFPIYETFDNPPNIERVYVGNYGSPRWREQVKYLSGELRSQNAGFWDNECLGIGGELSSRVFIFIVYCRKTGGDGGRRRGLSLGGHVLRSFWSSRTVL